MSRGISRYLIYATLVLACLSVIYYFAIFLPRAKTLSYTQQCYKDGHEFSKEWDAKEVKKYPGGFTDSFDPIYTYNKKLNKCLISVGKESYAYDEKEEFGLKLLSRDYYIRDVYTNSYLSEIHCYGIEDCSKSQIDSDDSRYSEWQKRYELTKNQSFFWD